MTKQEIESRFKAGEELIQTFYIRSSGYQIGDKRITQRQFNAAINIMPYRLDIIGLGITRHVYKYKPQ